MKLSLKVGGILLTCTDLAARDRFWKAAGVLLEDAVQNMTVADSVALAKELEAMVPVATVEAQTVATSCSTEKRDTSEDTYHYRGFVHILCPSCGEVTGTNLKEEQDFCRCRNCREEIVFYKPLRKLQFSCMCGKSFFYHTNRTEKVFDINCLNCEAPNSVEYHEKQGLYIKIDR